MDLTNKLLYAIETHNPEEINYCLKNGINANDIFEGDPLIEVMITMYTRTPRFKDCIQVFIDNGLEFEDKILLAVLIDDANGLKEMISSDPAIINKRYTMKCAYTPLEEVTLMHICAEYNHVACAIVLLENGTDINAMSALDEYGFGGQTPIFHTVNSNTDNSRAMMNFLLENNADLQHEVKGLIWGKGFDWETLIPAVNPISFAMMGLLPQMHRSEYQISDIVSVLLKKRYGIDYRMKNIPNKYLA